MKKEEDVSDAESGRLGAGGPESIFVGRQMNRERPTKKSRRLGREPLWNKEEWPESSTGTTKSQKHYPPARLADSWGEKSKRRGGSERGGWRRKGARNNLRGSGL